LDLELAMSILKRRVRVAVVKREKNGYDTNIKGSADCASNPNELDMPRFELAMCTVFWQLD
jgi:hypothetical protein